MELDWIERRAGLFPDTIALIDGTTRQEWTYKQLNEKAIRWGAYFHENAVGKGDRVLVVAHNSPKMIEVLFACQKLGAIFVPLNWRLSGQELAEQIEHAEPALLLFDEHTEELVSECVDKKIKCVSFEDQYLIEQNDPMLPTIEMTEEDPWMMIYTGGTTGKSKGAILSYRSVNWNAYNTIISWGLSHKDTTVTYLPMFHTGGLNALLLPVLMAGGKVIVANKFSPDEAMELLHEFECTIVLFVPTMYHMIVTDNNFERYPFASVNAFLSGGAPCPELIYERFSERGLPFKEGYGLTEAGPNNFYIHPKQSAIKRGSIGKPMLFNDVKIVDENGMVVGSGKVGELLIRGKHVFKEYFRNDEATKKTLQGGWLHTGDMAKCDEDGDYYIVGRKKEMIISGGENIYPAEIENILLRHPDVDEAAIVGFEDKKWGQKPVAFVASKNSVDVACLKVFMKQSLATYKVPKEIILITELPKTPVGKIDRNKLVSCSYGSKTLQIDT
ncbi:class I adenylate-forming enzyme family protein [Guptibacillus hwajinpoensis]|uniref:class I adenylate-forming enzyme family protein n=1 Tax=Guptibacillus hwajinpoensis TaxID=208199 RepID=UPI0037362051